MSSHAQHLVSHIRNPTLLNDNTLHVVSMVSNPVRFHRRYGLFRQYQAEMEATPNVKLHTVEVAYGDRPFEVTEAGNPRHLQLRTRQELWHKENAINLGVRHLVPREAKYIAWVDGDITFRNPEWAQETLHQLQHHPVVQPWQHVSDLGFEGDIMGTFDSFCSLYRRGIQIQTNPSEPYKYGHSGFAWACTRAFWEQAGGLMDFPILGSADHHMAWAMVGEVHKSVHGMMSEPFKRRCTEWQRRAYMLTKGNVGFVKGRIEHHFHGSKKNRQYRERWQLFIDHRFNPDSDLMYDQQGLLMLIGKPGLEQDIMRYMRHRNEDSIDP